MKLTPFYKLVQDGTDCPNADGIMRVHLWEDQTWDQQGGHSVAMPMSTYEDIRKEMRKLRSEVKRLTPKPCFNG